ncbi:Uncharacterised protein [Vibrio cholerae]|nr:Uncharacterised protein [Vibrio cholerae]
MSVIAPFLCPEYSMNTAGCYSDKEQRRYS